MRGRAEGDGALALSRDDCRRTLRRLELEAYASMVSVLRAQGHLRDERRKLLESVRTALHIGSDRHQAEARRASNDELLAAIAEQVCGPNTGLDWAREGRRKIPIMPRGVPQTVYTAIADRAAVEASEENDSIARRLLSERRNAPSPNSALENSEEEARPNETSDLESKSRLKDKNEPDVDYPPVVMSDRSLKITSKDEGPPKKRSRTDCTPTLPHRSAHQKHLDLSQIYTCYSKPHSGKVSHQYRGNVYNQSGKVSSKSNHSNLSKSNVSKHRSMQNKHGAKNCGQVTIPHHRVRSGIKSPTDPHIAGSQALGVQNQIDSNALKSQTSVFQAGYTQPTGQNVNNEDTNAGVTMLESPALQLLTQSDAHVSVASPVRIEEIPIMSPVHTITTTNITASSPAPKIVSTSSKTLHYVIKKKINNMPQDSQHALQKIQPVNKQILSKSELGNVKVSQSRQTVVTSSPSVNSQKILNSSGKLITTKIVQQIPPKSQTQIATSLNPQSVTNTQILDKVLIMPKTPTTIVQSGVLQRTISNSALKNIYISSHGTVTTRDEANNLLLKSGIPDASSKSVILNSPDGKLQTKTFLFNSKSGQKMVVLPANSPKPVPLLVKNVQGKSTMKLVPIIGQSPGNQSTSGNAAVMSKTGNANIIGTPTKIISKDANFKPNPNNDSHLPRVISNIQVTPKTSLKSIKQLEGTKGNVIVVQKGNTISKTPMTLTRGDIDLQRHITSPSLNEIHQSCPLSTDIKLEDSHEEITIDKECNPGIVIDIENKQIEQTEEYIDEVGDESMTQSSTEIKSDQSLITEETASLYPMPVTEEECNADSMESTTDSLIETGNVDDHMKSNDSFVEVQDVKLESDIQNEQSDVQSFTNWEVELHTAPAKEETIIDKSDELNLELEMSTDSDGEDYGVSSQEENKGNKEMSHEDGSQDEQEDTNELFVQHSTINQARRTLLSQLQDDGSSSNDSSFLLRNNLETGRLELLETSQTSSSAME